MNSPDRHMKIIKNILKVELNDLHVFVISITLFI